VEGLLTPRPRPPIVSYYIPKAVEAMQIGTFLGLVGIVSVGFGSATLTGCGTTTNKEPAPAFQGGGEAPPTTAQQAPAYPAGPYGVGVGSVIKPLAFYGFHNPAVAADPNNMEQVSLAEFYNPTGQDTYAADSPYRPGEAKPKALLVDVSAFWCPPCQQESKVALPAEYPMFQPQGLEVLLELNQDLQGGPALPKDLVKWTATYKSAWPSVIDPESAFGPIYEQEAFPGNFLIDTSTMKIVYAIAGAPDLTDPTDPIHAKLEALLNK
jgi:hypothetical protein